MRGTGATALVPRTALRDIGHGVIGDWDDCVSRPVRCLFGRAALGGFSAHNRVRVGDRDGRMKLAGYRIRAPMSLEKMTYDRATGTVIYRSKMHLGLKRNFQVMPGAQWRELLCKHIPDRYEHLVRYVGLCEAPQKPT